MAENQTEAITKVSEIDTSYLADYLRIDDADDATKRELATMLASAKGFVASFTGINPVADGEAPTDPPSEALTLDSKPEFVTAVVVLVQNQYDNRTFYTDKGKVEEVVNSILGMHRVNFL